MYISIVWFVCMCLGCLRPQYYLTISGSVHFASLVCSCSACEVKPCLFPVSEISMCDTIFVLRLWDVRRTMLPNLHVGDSKIFVVLFFLWFWAIFRFENVLEDSYWCFVYIRSLLFEVYVSCSVDSHVYSFLCLWRIVCVCHLKCACVHAALFHFLYGLGRSAMFLKHFGGPRFKMNFALAEYYAHVGM